MVGHVLHRTPADGNKPSITGPGLAGGGFYDANGGCSDYGNDQTGDAGGDRARDAVADARHAGRVRRLHPGRGQGLHASTSTANVISSAGDAALSVADASSTAPGHLVNGAFSLPTALKASAASPAGTSTGVGTISGSPLNLLSWSDPVSNDAVAFTFTQSIGATDALRTGSYAKTLTFTLSTTTP